jgi:general secretion pathway protein A
MLLDFYRLHEQPFGPTPDPRFIYPSPAHRQAAAALRQGIESGCGFLALIAPPGLGKTSLLFKLLEELKPTARTAFLFQTGCTEREFLQSLVHDLGITDADGNLALLQAKLNQLLIEEAEAGRRVVLVVDEAQNLGEPVLEMARMLTNFETPQRKLLQVVLAGQPQLASILRRQSMAQLLQRISVLAHLSPLTTREVEHFIRHRLQVAGHTGESPFPTRTVAAIAEASRGIPRLINDICFASLARGFATQRPTIDAGMVWTVATDLSLSSLVRRVTPKAVRPTHQRLRALPFLPSLLRNLKLPVLISTLRSYLEPIAKRAVTLPSHVQRSNVRGASQARW